VSPLSQILSQGQEAMPSLRTKLEAIVETVSELEAAAEQKYWEGLELMVAGNYGAGIYLMGYAVEMWVKSACARLLRVRPDEDVWVTLEPRYRIEKRSFPKVKDKGPHSLELWGELLCHIRNVAGVGAFSRPVSADSVRTASKRLHESWWVEMRYHEDRASYRDVQQVEEVAAWFRKHQISFWR